MADGDFSCHSYFPLMLLVLAGRLELGHIERTETSRHALRIDSRARLLCTWANCKDPVNDGSVPIIKYFLARFWTFRIRRRRIEHAR